MTIDFIEQFRPNAPFVVTVSKIEKNVNENNAKAAIFEPSTLPTATTLAMACYAIDICTL